MQNDKQSIRTTTWVVITIAVILIAGYFGYLMYQGSQQQKIILEKVNKEQQDLLQKQQAELEQTKAEIGKIADAQKISQEATQKAQNSALEAQRKLQEQQNNNPDLSSVVTQWRPFVAYIECDFTYTDTNGTKNLTLGGSGILIINSPTDASVLTNKHVVMYKSKYPTVCRIQIPNDKNIFYVDYDNIIPSPESSGLDGAFLRIKQPDNYIKNLTSVKIMYCAGTPSIGDSIVILGYPSIGSTTDITATEGIISGYDGDYYITSAKVEHGNSGGLAISLKNNCYLGLPTFVEAGSLESLARILPFAVLMK